MSVRRPVWTPVHGAPPALEPLHVHLWRAPLDLAPELLARLGGALSAEEREKARRFRFDQHRNRFVAGRGIQRDILSRYLGLAPHAVEYHASRYGKLSVAGAALHFNASNSGGLALYAVSRAGEVGVDLEAVSPMPDALGIARGFFSEAERATLEALPQEVHDWAFFSCWTRKEAFIKAVGEGLSMPLDCFDVAFAPGEEPRLLRVRRPDAEAHPWTMSGFEPADGHLGALVVRGEALQPLYLDWRG